MRLSDIRELEILFFFYIDFSSRSMKVQVFYHHNRESLTSEVNSVHRIPFESKIYFCGVFVMDHYEKLFTKRHKHSIK